MPVLDAVTLRCNGADYHGWQSVTITDAITQAAASFELGVTERWQRDDNGKRELHYWPLRAGDACQVQIAGRTIISGYIDVHNPSISPTSHSVRISGRSKTGDLIDCSTLHQPGNFNGQTVQQIATAIATPFGITVEMEAGLAPPTVDKFEIDQGESAFEAIERLCRKHQLLLIPTPDGNLQLTHSGRTNYPFVLAESEWVSASVTVDYSRRFSAYHAKAQRHGYDDTDPLQAARVHQITVMPDVARYRPLIVRPEGTTATADAKKRIDWQASHDLGDSLKMQVTVLGFHTPVGTVWKKNQRVHVYSRTLGVDQALLIESVRFEKSERGTFTTLQMTHPAAYQPKPPATQKKVDQISEKNEKGGYFDL